MTPTQRPDAGTTRRRNRVPPLARHGLLAKWLSPKVDGDPEVGRFIGRPVSEIAEAFNDGLENPVSERTVLRYLHEALEWARRRAERAQRQTGPEGKVGGSVGAAEEVPTSPRPRGRPKSESPRKPRRRIKKASPAAKLPSLTVTRRRAKRDADHAAMPASAAISVVATRVIVATEKLQASPSERSRAKPGPKPRAKRWRRVWSELQALTGWSARKLYAHLAEQPTLVPLIGSRASFVEGLAELGAPRTAWDPVFAIHAVPDASDDAFTADLRASGVMHVLHVHPVLLSTPRGEWAVLLLAFDPQSQFINAMLLDFDGPSEAASAPRPPGRPRKPRDDDWTVTIEAEGEATQIHVPAAAYWTLVTDTVGKTGIPYSPIWLSPGVAGGDTLLDALRQCSPSDTFARSPVAPWPCAPLPVSMSIQALRKGLAREINAHNRAFAQPNLRKVRARIDELIDRGRVPPSILAKLEEDGLYDARRDHILILGMPHPPRPDVRRFALLSVFQAGYPRLSARGHFVSIKPRRVRSRFISQNAA